MLFIGTRLRAMMGAGFATDEQVEANISARGGGADSDSDEEAPEAANISKYVCASVCERNHSQI